MLIVINLTIVWTIKLKIRIRGWLYEENRNKQIIVNKRIISVISEIVYIKI